MIIILFSVSTPTTPTTPTPSSTLPVVNPTPPTIVEAAPVNVQIVRPTQTVTQIRIQTTAPPANAAANTRKGLSLTVSFSEYVSNSLLKDHSSSKKVPFIHYRFLWNQYENSLSNFCFLRSCSIPKTTITTKINERILI